MGENTGKENHDTTSTDNNNTQSSHSGTDQSAKDTPSLRRALIIGVGSTGYNTLILLRRLFLERFGSLRNLPVRFLCLETAQDQIQQKITEFDHAELRLQESEWLPLGLQGAADIDINNYPGLKGWVSPDDLKADIRDGAGNVRSRGRLAFFWNYSEINSRIKAHWRAIQEKDDLADSDSSKAVYVIGTLGGGTCSGCFIDLGYALRGITQEGGASDIIGYYSIVDDSSSQVLKANCYAALKELNHFNGEGQYRAQHINHEELSFAAGEYPYDLPYLMSSDAGDAGYVLSEEQLAEIVGLDIFNDISAPQFRSMRWGARDNIKTQCLAKTDDIGCPQRYITMGLATIQYPAYKYRHVCAMQLALDLLDSWLRAGGNVSANDLAGYAHKQLEDENIVTPQKESALDGSRLQRKLFSANQKTLCKAVDDWVAAQRTKLDAWCRENCADVAGFLGYTHEKDLLPLCHDMTSPRNLSMSDAEELLVRPIPGNLSEVKRSLHRRAEEELRNKEKALEEIIQRSIENSAYRVDNTLEILKNMQSQLELERKSSKEAIGPLFAKAQQSKEHWDRALSALKATGNSLAVRMVTVGHPQASVKAAAEKVLETAYKWHADQTRAVIEEYMCSIYLYLLRRIRELENDVLNLQQKLQQARSELTRRQETYFNQSGGLMGEIVDPHKKEKDPILATAAQGNTDEIRNKVALETMLSLTGARNAPIFELRNTSVFNLISTLVRTALPRFEYIRQRDVLTDWANLHPDEKERRDAFQKVWDDAKIHMNLVPDHDSPRVGREQQRLVAYHTPTVMVREEVENQLRELGLKPGEYKDIGQEPFRLIMLQEYGGFPLRIWPGLSGLHQAYNLNSNPSRLHSRFDINQWAPLEDVPSSTLQAEAWQLFVIGWALGVIRRRVSQYNEGGAYFNYIASGMSGEEAIDTSPMGTPPPLDGQGRRPGTETPKDQPGIGMLPPSEMRPVVFSLHASGISKLKDAVERAVTQVQSEQGNYAGVALYSQCNEFWKAPERRLFQGFWEKPLELFIDKMHLGKPANKSTSRISWPESKLTLSISKGKQRLPVQGFDEHGSELPPLWLLVEFKEGQDVVEIDATGMAKPLRPGIARVVLQAAQTLQGTLEQEIEIEIVN